MRKYREHFDGRELDLDDPTIYAHLPNTVNELNDRMLKEIGYAICYMDYWHPDVFGKEKKEPILTDESGAEIWTKEEIEKGYPDGLANSGFYQRQRVYGLIENFTKNRRDNWKNIQWFKEQVFLFEDEIENMC